jgi:hypothetical protein
VPRAPIAPGHLRPDDDDGTATRDQPEAALERGRGGEERPGTGMAVAHVEPEVLPHAERDRPAAHGGEDRERDGERVRAEQPYRVHAREHRPEPAQRLQQRPRRLRRAGERAVVRQRLEVKLGGHCVMPPPARRVEPSDERDALEVVRQPREEVRERHLRPQAAVVAAIGVVAVDGDSHGSALSDGACGRAGAR